ncbi:tyrosine-type recombinase/integrase [Sagittula sp. SSi028]|uniref:tyrosine-type recombinase/integrase n=1 Tax=Sagittula sp. SSi028 TaxID=3400636 RepID=UPI003AF750B6
MLTDTKLRKVKTGEKPLSVGGAPGLWFKVGAQNGQGKFYLRFTSPQTSKRRDMGLGKYPETSLAQARAAALSARELIAQGLDPIAQRDAKAKAAIAEPTVPTFECAARQTFAAIQDSYKNDKHRAQWLSTLESYIFPEIGKTPVDQLSTADFATALAPIWLTKAETASRVRQRCTRVMNYCVAQRWSDINPVFAVDALLPKQPSKADRVAHHPAVPWRELPEVMPKLFPDDLWSASRDALLFLILTASRSGEVRGASWDEFDLEAAVWTIPGARMKAKRQHRVPLSVQAVEIIERRKVRSPGGALVFSHRGDKPLSDMTLTKLLRDRRIQSDVPERIATAHGFRSSFRDWASENGYARDLAERALAHTIKNATEAAYHRTDQLEQRRPMMQAWAKHVSPTE